MHVRCVGVPRSFWQRNEFRSSFSEPIGRQMSFGVVKTPSARYTALFSWNMRFQKGYSSPIPLLKQQNSTSHGAGRASCPEIITPKLDSLPMGTPGLLRNSIRCQWDSREMTNGFLTAPPGPVLGTGAGGEGSGFGTTCPSSSVGGHDWAPVSNQPIGSSCPSAVFTPSTCRRIADKSPAVFVNQPRKTFAFFLHWSRSGCRASW